ncbi:MAG: cytochrome c oxidase subunit II [Acidimicrobiia bacterium]|nr:cytochrome c oxidase subunit II [Acidimicrobiia bacterium]
MSPSSDELIQAPRHVRRILIIWAVLAVIATPLLVIFLAPHLPPGDATVQARNQQVINTIFMAMVTPIVLAVVVYVFYSFIVFKDRSDDRPDSPVLRGDRRVTVLWIIGTCLIVAFVVPYGTWQWMGPGVGSGSAQGPKPIAVPDGKILEVQVIGQQWQFTYRYPSFGGIETQELVIPENQYVGFHVTSLDVNHSFWAVGLGVKADAVNGADNVVFAKATRPGPFKIRCAELCGLWHGQMYQQGARVVSATTFQTWIDKQIELNEGLIQYLPPYAHTYFPQPFYRGD